MIAVLAVVPVDLALLAVLVPALLRVTGTAPARPPQYGSAWVAAHLDDYSWRREQVRLGCAEWWQQAHAYAASIAPVYADLRRPAREPQRPGIDVIARWWQPPSPTAHMGRPPLARRAPGATLIGAAA